MGEADHSQRLQTWLQAERCIGGLLTPLTHGGTRRPCGPQAPDENHICALSSQAEIFKHPSLFEFSPLLEMTCCRFGEYLLERFLHF